MNRFGLAVTLFSASLATSCCAKTPDSCKCATPLTLVQSSTETPNTLPSAAIYPSMSGDQYIYENRTHEYAVVFHNLKWKDWEPTEGKFARPALDNLITVARSASPARKLALRFQVIDEGCKCEQPDWIDPSWVVETTGETGQDCAGQPVWSVKWDDPNVMTAVMTAHKKALNALGQWVHENRDHVAWVELGSVGFWGEWHFHGTPGLTLPSRQVMGQIVDQYLCAFPQAPLSIAFDALKDNDTAAAPNDDVRRRLREGKAGLYFDSFGGQDADFTDYMVTKWTKIDGKTVGQEFEGPFGLEFQGDSYDDPNDNEPAPKEGSFYVLNNSTTWGQSLKLLEDFPFMHVRQGGEDLLVPDAARGRDDKRALNPGGKKRLVELIDALNLNTHSKPNKQEPNKHRLKWLEDQTRCKSCGDDETACLARTTTPATSAASPSGPTPAPSPADSAGPSVPAVPAP